MVKKIALTFLATLISFPLFAEKLQVAAAYPYIASIVEQVGGGSVEVQSIATGDWDPHYVIPKPSHIARLRRADLLIINGGQLEIGWLPPLIRQANNPNINPGSPGFLDLSQFVRMMDATPGISRSGGDVHPDGNPHYHLNPDNVPLLSMAIAKRLSRLDPAGESMYMKNNSEFTKKWRGKTAEWENSLREFKGKPIIEYHLLFDYFLRRFGFKNLGTVEALPGIPPTSKHMDYIDSLIASESVGMILQDVYHPDEASKHIAAKHGIRLVKLPHDVGALSGASDIFSLFDEIIRRLKNE